MGDKWYRKPKITVRYCIRAFLRPSKLRSMSCEENTWPMACCSSVAQWMSTVEAQDFTTLTNKRNRPRDSPIRSTCPQINLCILSGLSSSTRSMNRGTNKYMTFLTSKYCFGPPLSEILSRDPRPAQSPDDIWHKVIGLSNHLWSACLPNCCLLLKEIMLINENETLITAQA